MELVAGLRKKWATSSLSHTFLSQRMVQALKQATSPVMVLPEVRTGQEREIEDKRFLMK
jgi:hypothetical protein